MRNTIGFGLLLVATTACDIGTDTPDAGEAGTTGITQSSSSSGAAPMTGESTETGDPAPESGTSSDSSNESSSGGVDVGVAYEGLVQSVDTGWCVGAAALVDGAALESTPCGSADALRLAASGESGSLELRVAETTLCIALSQDDNRDGTPFVLASCTEDATQRFDLGESETAIAVASSGSCMDFNPGEGPGDPLKQWTCHGMINQQFRFIDEANGESALVQGLIDDMAEDASCPIAELVNGQIQPVQPGGYPSTQSALVMGFMAHGQASPAWWNPAPTHNWVRGAAWPVVTPWIVALSCTDNSATETRIEMRNFKAYALLESTGAWEELVPPSAVDGYVCPPGQWDNCAGATDITIEDGLTSVLAAGTGSNFHGWSTSGGRVDDPNDVQLYVASVEARIVGPDTDAARYVLHVGTDFYPDDVGVNELGGYNPGAGFARSRLLRTDWETYGFATIDASPVINDGQWATPTQVLIDNPPPGFE